MEKIEDLVHNFLAQKSIAVIGVSNKRETGCNLNYKRFKENGYRVYPVNPHISTYDGMECYPDLISIPEKPDAVFMLTNQTVTEHMVRQCVELGIKHVWMHCMMGTKPGLGGNSTSVSQSAVEMCRMHGVAVIPGSCPAQFLAPDFSHALMRRLWKACGFLKVS